MTGWRRWIRFRPGDRKRIKRGYRRRVRRWAQRMLGRELAEPHPTFRDWFEADSPFFSDDFPERDQGAQQEREGL